MVKRNADGSLKVVGALPDLDWLLQLRQEDPDDLDPEEA
jgi:hypothetical protein